MTEKRFKVAVYDDKAINGFAVLDLQKPNSSKRLKYENVYIGSKEGCEIVCNFGNSLADENEQLKSDFLNRKLFVPYKKEIERLKLQNKELLTANATIRQENEQLKHWNKCLAEKRHQELSYRPYTASKSEKELKELLEPKLFNCSDR